MKFSYIFLLLISFFQLKAQSDQNSIKKELDFISYMLSNQDYEITLTLCNRLLEKNNLTDKIRDSLNFIKAWCFYHQKKLDSAATFFSLVDSHIYSYVRAKFFGSICYAYINQYDRSQEILNEIHSDCPEEVKLRDFVLAGIALLKRNDSLYLKLRPSLDTNWFPIAREIKKMDKYKQILSSYKTRKKYKAALMSSVVPGLGKWYAGRPGDGAAAFLITTSLALVSYENFKKDGLKNFKTIFFGGLFLTYYLGNIIGSYYSVNLERQEFYGQIDYNILYDLHIAVRNVYY